MIKMFLRETGLSGKTGMAGRRNQRERVRVLILSAYDGESELTDYVSDRTEPD